MSNKTDAKIDQIVDELVADDAIAEQLKTKLHGQVESMSDGVAQTQNQTVDDAEEDLWDNIPV